MEKIDSVLYSRVSTEDADQDLSITNQMLFNDERFNITHRAGERKSAFKDFKERKELIFILENYFGIEIDIKRGNIVSFYPSEVVKPVAKTLIVSNLSRLSRHVNQCTGIIDALHQNNCNVYIQDIDKFSDSDDMLINILASLEMGFSKTMSSKIKVGQQRSGKYAFNGTYIGWDYIKEENKLVINQEEAKLISTAFDMYSDGYGARLIGKAIGKTTGSTQQYLKNEMYKGFYKGKLCSNIEPIISEELFDKCMNIRASKEKYITYNAPRGLARKLQCQCCGKYYTRHKSAGSVNQYFYLKCRRRHIEGEDSCPSVNLKYETLNEWILEELERQETILQYSFDNIISNYSQGNKKDLENRINKTKNQLIELALNDINRKTFKLVEEKLLNEIQGLEDQLREYEDIKITIDNIINLKNRFKYLINQYIDYMKTGREDLFYNEILHIDVGIKMVGDKIEIDLNNLKLIQFKHLYDFLDKNKKPFLVTNLVE